MEKVIKFRRDLHQIPEESLKEYKTKNYIVDVLKTLDCEINYISDTGVVAYFDNGKETTVALRSDMDALPIEEINEVEYVSIHKGFSHACGHDGHMSMLLGAALYLNENRNIKNNVVLIFQAAEETIDGADLIIESNILDKYNVKAVFGMHIWPNLDCGKVYTKEKELCAMATKIDIEVLGKSAHVANYEDGIDALLISSNILLDIYNMDSKLDKNIYRLIKFGRFESGTVRNAVSEVSILEGTLRAYDEKVYDFLLNNIKEICKSYEEKYSCKVNIKLSKRSNAVINNEYLANTFLENGAIKLEKPYMQAEDFGSYCVKYPSCFFLLGCGYGMTLHTNNFNFDESILNVGVNLYKDIVNREFKL